MAAAPAHLIVALIFVEPNTACALCNVLVTVPDRPSQLVHPRHPFFTGTIGRFCG